MEALPACPRAGSEEVAIPAAAPRQHRVAFAQAVRTWAGVVAVAGMLALAVLGLGALDSVEVEFRPALDGLPPTLTVVLLALGIPLVLVTFALRLLRGRRDTSGAGSARRWIVFGTILLLIWLIRDLLDRRALQSPEAEASDTSSAPDLLPGWSAGATGIVIALLVSAAVLLVWRRRTANRIEPATAPAAAAGPEPGHEPTAFPRRDPDGPRDQLVGYFAAMEADLAAAGAPRQASETQTEYLRRTTSAGLVPEVPAARLTDLFVVARFSDRPVDPVDLAAARAALDQVETALNPDARPGRDASALDRGAPGQDGPAGETEARRGSDGE